MKKQQITIPLPKNTVDETGHTYGRLKVQSYAGLVDAKAGWNCRCECGAAVVARGDRLRTDRVVSCGCWRADKDVRQAARMKTPPKRRAQIARVGAAARWRQA